MKGKKVFSFIKVFIGELFKGGTENAGRLWKIFFALLSFEVTRIGVVTVEVFQLSRDAR